MHTLIGALILIFPGVLYVAQIISSVNFPLAQKLGLQEKPEHTDSIVSTAEQYVAYWDLFTMGWMPLTGLLIMIENPYWPYVGLVAGSIYFDTAGREAVKVLAFKKEKIRVGPESQHKWFMATYVIMLMIALPLIYCSMMEIL